ncbi:hypothetical protein BJ742DRAFT_506086 [Cladochytrium replicatum]|nr:hypothetical protein BJ742DRAFT_506086 [Cladochytrium replicatum]
MNWAALHEAGVGLVVNATEAPILPPSARSPPTSPVLAEEHPHSHTPSLTVVPIGDGSESTVQITNTTILSADHMRNAQVCPSCYYVHEEHDGDLFSDLLVNNDEAGSGMRVLSLPIPDGSVPHISQVAAFLHAAYETIHVHRKKVVVHCQAGVGRTGTLLAIWLMETKGLDARTAIHRLRYWRPQSLQFYKRDWQSWPFRLPFHIEPPPEDDYSPADNNVLTDTTPQGLAITDDDDDDTSSLLHYIPASTPPTPPPPTEFEDPMARNLLQECYVQAWYNRVTVPLQHYRRGHNTDSPLSQLSSAAALTPPATPSRRSLLDEIAATDATALPPTPPQDSNDSDSDSDDLGNTADKVFPVALPPGLDGPIVGSMIAAMRSRFANVFPFRVRTYLPRAGGLDKESSNPFDLLVDVCKRGCGRTMRWVECEGVVGEELRGLSDGTCLVCRRVAVVGPFGVGVKREEGSGKKVVWIGDGRIVKE